jgi:hypothetical protein
MEKSSNTIGNRTRELSVCSAVPQPLRHRVPPNKLSTLLILEYKINPREWWLIFMGVSIRNLLCIRFLEPEIESWLLGLWKLCAPLTNK